MNRFSVDDCDTRITFSEWKALGFDAHSLLSSPEQLFVNPGGSDFRLKEGSPAIDQESP